MRRLGQRGFIIDPKHNTFLFVLDVLAFLVLVAGVVYLSRPAPGHGGMGARGTGGYGAGAEIPVK